MDRASEGLRFEGSSQPGFDPSAGPVDRASAIALIQHADELMEASEPDQALIFYARTTGVPDRDVAAAGLFGVGNALYRLDRETEALEAWERVTAMPDSPATYRAWRQIAAARVRAKDLSGALDAYRQCERRAPAADKALIASRLGWLSKETGNTRAAGRYFARSRGDALPYFMTYLIIAVTVVTSLIAMEGGQVIQGFGGSFNPGGPLELQLQLDKYLVAHGEIYRLLSVVLVHDPNNLLHLGFNMYALWYSGQLVERMYGARLMLFFYIVTGIAASLATYVLGSAQGAVGASGAIFGLFGVVLVATRVHHAVLDTQSRAIASQVAFLIVVNLFLGLSGILGNVDNYAHIGGLAAGVWLALVMPPGRVPTLASLWQSPSGAARSRLETLGLPALGVAGLIAVMVVGYVIGTDKWHTVPDRPFGIVTPVSPSPPSGVLLMPSDPSWRPPV
jgi:membrane associated rhomboid family serine protease